MPFCKTARLSTSPHPHISLPSFTRTLTTPAAAREPARPGSAPVLCCRPAGSKEGGSSASACKMSWFLSFASSRGPSKMPVFLIESGCNVPGLEGPWKRHSQAGCGQRAANQPPWANCPRCLAGLGLLARFLGWRDCPVPRLLRTGTHEGCKGLGFCINRLYFWLVHSHKT